MSIHNSIRVKIFKNLREFADSVGIDIWGKFRVYSNSFFNYNKIITSLFYA